MKTTGTVTISPLPVSPALLRKQFGVALKGQTNDKTRTIPFSITTFVVDRMGEVVLPKGGRFENYLQNPVVLFGHNSQDLPVGACLEISKNDQEVSAITQFAGLDQLHPFAETVYRLYRDRFLRAVSIVSLLFNPSRCVEELRSYVKRTETSLRRTPSVEQRVPCGGSDARRRKPR
jgi:hypothetical protein